MAKVGIRQIAEKAGVSIATVSHALRNPGRVSDATRAKVLKAADEWGYTPNSQAQSLRTARSGNIVVIIPDIADSHNAGIISGIEKVARMRSYSVLLGDCQGSEQREREFAAMVRSRQADGIILMSHRLPFDIDEEKKATDELPPLVNGCEFTGYEHFPTVSIDDEAAAVDATEHLIDYGHKKIAVITGDINSQSTKDRLKGFGKAMARAGLPVNERFILYGDYSASGGEAATSSLLAQEERPTAIFCLSDEIALGCKFVLRQQGFNVPNDISIMGFDNILFAKYLAPPLTTIAQPAEEIGATCATLLLDQLGGKRIEPGRIFLPHELIVRESTRRIH